MQKIGHSMMQNCSHPRIACQNFISTASCRITFIGGLNIGLKRLPNLRQMSSEVANNLSSLLTIILRNWRIPLCKDHLQGDLFIQIS